MTTVTTNDALCIYLVLHAMRRALPPDWNGGPAVVDSAGTVGASVGSHHIEHVFQLAGRRVPIGRRRRGVGVTLPGKKVCSKCGKRKALGGFYQNAKFRDGYTSQCKDATGESARVPISLPPRADILGVDDDLFDGGKQRTAHGRGR